MSIFTSIRNFVTKPFKKALDWLLPEIDDNRGVLIQKEGTNNPYPVVYGEATVPAVKIFKLPHNESGGAKNEYLNLICVFCEGEVQNIEEIYFNDIASSQIPSERYYIEKFTGADDQVYSAELGSKVSTWKSTATLSGLCYAYVRLKINKDLDWWQGEPQIKARIKGRKVKDVRTNLIAYSTNPANILFDYLTNQRFAKGSVESELDIDTFKTAADYCDVGETYDVIRHEYEYDQESGTLLAFNPTTVTVTNARMSCNILLDTNKKVLDNVKELVSGCRGLLIPGENGFKFSIEKGGLPVYTFDDDNVVDGEFSSQGSDKNSYFNRVTVRYPSWQLNGQYDEVSWPEAESSVLSGFLTQDNNIPLEKSFDFPTINNAAEALQMAEVVCRRSRDARQVKFVGQPWTIVVETGDIVALNDSTHGWVNKAFRVIDKTLNLDASISFVVIEHQDAIYPWSINEVNEYYPDTSLAVPSDIAAPTGLAFVETPLDGFYQGEITWDDANDTLVNEYYLVVKQGESIVKTFEITDPIVKISTLPIGDYDLTLYARNSLYQSTGTPLSITITVAPATGADVISVFSTSQVFIEDDNEVVSPDAITLTVQTNSQETVVWSTEPEITLTGQGDSRSLAKADFGDNSIVTVTVSAGAITDKISVFKLKNGSSGLTGFLTNETHVVAADKDGNITGGLSGSGGSFVVFLGTKNVTGDCTFSKTGQSGLSSSISATTGVYSVSSVTANAGTVTFNANYNGIVLSKSYSVSKSIAGLDGEAGADGLPGEDGAPGSNGTNGQRGSQQFYREIIGEVWSNTEANAAITDDGLIPVIRDMVTLYNNSKGYSETRFYDGTSWLTIAQVVDGNLLVDGSVSAAKLIVDEIFAQAITATGSITGGTIQSGTSGTRAVMKSGTDPFAVYVGSDRVFGISDGQIFFDGQIAPGSIPNLDVFPEHIKNAIINTNVDLGAGSSGGNHTLTNQTLTTGTTTTKTLTVNPCNAEGATIGFTLIDGAQQVGGAVYTAPQWQVVIRRNNASGTIVYNQTFNGTAHSTNEGGGIIFNEFSLSATDSYLDTAHGKTEGQSLTYVFQITKLAGSATTPKATTLSLDQKRLGGGGGSALENIVDVAGGVSVSGNLLLSGNLIGQGDVGGFSDKRIKQDIVKIENPLEILSKIKGVTFRRKDLNLMPQAGVIAQDVKQAFPLAAGEVDGTLTVKHMPLIGLLIEAVNQQQQTINYLLQVEKNG